jgi:hypothetical protein
MAFANGPDEASGAPCFSRKVRIKHCTPLPLDLLESWGYSHTILKIFEE